MVNLFYPNEEAKNSKLKNIEYYKQLGSEPCVFSVRSGTAINL